MFRNICFASLFCLVISGAALGEVDVRHADMLITLPSNPERSSEGIPGADGKTSTQHRLVINGAEGAIIVWHQDSPPKVDVQAAFKRFRDSVAKTAGGDVVIDEALTQQDYPGRMFLVTIPAKNGYFRVVYFHAEGRFYQVMAVGSLDFVRSDAVHQMFASVKFASAK